MIITFEQISESISCKKHAQSEIRLGFTVKLDDLLQTANRKTQYRVESI